MNKSIAFFDAQFERQVASNELVLNPFELAILPLVRGDVLDLGCGLGNLTMAAARAGSAVLALDGSENAIKGLTARANAEGLSVRAEQRDLAEYSTDQYFDTVLCIGLLMFFPEARAYAWLDTIKAITRPNGIVAINVLIEGTTYLDMFDPMGYTLFSEERVMSTFRNWKILHAAVQEFDAPHGTVKRFLTLAAEKPASAAP